MWKETEPVLNVALVEPPSILEQQVHLVVVSSMLMGEFFAEYNVKLFEWRIIYTPLCSFCKKQIETTQNLFFDCERVQAIWQELTSFIFSLYQEECTVTYKNVIFNEISTNKRLVINFMCLIVKQYVYKKRCTKKPLNFFEVKSLFKGIGSMEKYIATKNNKMNKHVNKWQSKNKKEATK